jgi:hypothetical protein
VPQLPQFDASEANIDSQPLLKLPSQLPKPTLQAMLQAPAEQPAVPLAVPQTLLQLPQ